MNMNANVPGLTAAGLGLVLSMLLGLCLGLRPAAARAPGTTGVVGDVRILSESPWPTGNDRLTGPISDPGEPGYALGTAHAEVTFADLWRAFYWARTTTVPEISDGKESVVLALWHAPCGYREFQRVQVTESVVEVVVSEHNPRPCVALQSPFAQFLVVAVPKQGVPEGEVVVRLRSDSELIGQTRGVLRPVGWQPPVEGPSLLLGAVIAGGGGLLLALLGVVVFVVRRDRSPR